jgi:hypothetical protein
MMAMVVSGVFLWLLFKVSKMLAGACLILLFLAFPMKTAIVFLVLLVLLMPT